MDISRLSGDKIVKRRIRLILFLSEAEIGHFILVTRILTGFIYFYTIYIFKPAGCRCKKVVIARLCIETEPFLVDSVIFTVLYNIICQLGLAPWLRGVVFHFSWNLYVLTIIVALHYNNNDCWPMVIHLYDPYMLRFWAGLGVLPMRRLDLIVIPVRIRYHWF